MKIEETKPPRRFIVGTRGEVQLAEVAKIALETNELVTFIGLSGSEHDVTGKEWGFYATQSVNYRLPTKGLRAALVKNTQGRWFVLLVEKTTKAQAAFADYCRSEEVTVIAWLDDEATLAKIETALWQK